MLPCSSPTNRSRQAIETATMNTRFIQMLAISALLAPKALDAQLNTPPREAVAAAIKHLRKELPPGKVVIEVSDQLQAADAELAAREVQGQATRMDQVVTCTAFTGKSKECKFTGGVVGTLGLQSAQVGTETVVLRLSTRVEDKGAWNSLNYSEYLVYLKKAGAKKWTVVRSVLSLVS